MEAQIPQDTTHEKKRKEKWGTAGKNGFWFRRRAGDRKSVV